MLYKIYECEILAKRDGGQYKKLVLQAPDAQHPEKRVTLWDNHPQYEQAKAGGEISGFLEKKDSGTPIPDHAGKNYVNRTLLAEGSEPEKPSTPLESRIVALEIWATSKGFGAKTKEVQIDYPEAEGEEIPFE